MTATTCTTCGATFVDGASACSICGSEAAPDPGASGPTGSSSPHADPAGAGPTGTGSTAGAATATPPRPTMAASLTSEQRAWSIGAHLGGLGLALSSAAILGFVAPLVVWLVRKDEDPYTEHHAKEALNFQLTVLLAIVAFTVLLIPGVIIGVLTLGVGLVLGAVAVAAATVAWFVLPIIATVKASNGEGYRYPLTIRFIR